LAEQDLQYRLKLAEDEQSERIKAVIYVFTATLFISPRNHIVMFRRL